MSLEQITQTTIHTEDPVHFENKAPSSLDRRWELNGHPMIHDSAAFALSAAPGGTLSEPAAAGRHINRALNSVTLSRPSASGIDQPLGW